MFFASNIVMADPDDGEEENIRHYEFEIPANKSEALELLNSSIDSIAKSIDENDMPAVHETSYKSEAAIKGLQQLTRDDSLVEKLQELWEINEEMHAASETEEINVAKVQEEFNKLKDSWKLLSASF